MPPKTKVKADKSNAAETANKGRDETRNDNVPKKSTLTNVTRGKKKVGKGSKAMTRTKSTASKKGKMKSTKPKSDLKSSKPETTKVKSPQRKASESTNKPTKRSTSKAQSKKATRSKRSLRLANQKSVKQKSQLAAPSEPKKESKMASSIEPGEKPQPPAVSDLSSQPLPTKRAANTFSQPASGQVAPQSPQTPSPQQFPGYAILAQQQAGGHQGWPPPSQQMISQPYWIPQPQQMPGQAPEPMPGRPLSFYGALYSEPQCTQQQRIAEQQAQYSAYSASQRMPNQLAKLGAQRGMPAPRQGYYGQHLPEPLLSYMQAQQLRAPSQMPYDSFQVPGPQQMPPQASQMPTSQPTADQANGATVPQQPPIQTNGTTGIQQFAEEPTAMTLAQQMPGQPQPQFFYGAPFPDQTQSYIQQQQMPLDSYGNLMGSDGQEQMMLPGQNSTAGQFLQLAPDQSDPYGTKGGMPAVTPVTCLNEAIGRDPYFQQFDVTNQTQNLISPMQEENQFQDPATRT